MAMQLLIDDEFTLRSFRVEDRDDLVVGLNDWAVARWLARSFWGRRIMCRAADRMIEEVLVRAPATRLIASANHDNHRSQALILRLGFVEDGGREVMSTPLQRPVRLRCFRRP